MIPVKNVTTYTVALNVARPQDFTSLLSRIKEYSAVDNEPQLIMRKDWAKTLGISRKTIERWEKHIINSHIKFAYLYYNGNQRKNKLGLDWYQRFFLTLIHSLLDGLVTGLPMTYGQVIAWLEDKQGNKPRWMRLARPEFQKWDEFYRHKQAS